MNAGLHVEEKVVEVAVYADADHLARHGMLAEVYDHPNFFSLSSIEEVTAPFCHHSQSARDGCSCAFCLYLRYRCFCCSY
jgi:hypothetical protein